MTIIRLQEDKPQRRKLTKSEQYAIDEQFSRDKDKLLKHLWEKLSYEGRYVIVKSDSLQYKCSADIILQGPGEDEDTIVDTKNIRRRWYSLFLEHLQQPDYANVGWLAKTEGWPDYIAYCYWPGCEDCYLHCAPCEKPKYPAYVYLINFKELREWFMLNEENYPKSYPKNNEGEITGESKGRVVPISDIAKAVTCKHYVVSAGKDGVMEGNNP